MNFKNKVGLFFIINGKPHIHLCSFSAGIYDGVFINYPLSHLTVWEKYYQEKYQQDDYSYFPRGRIIYEPEKELYRVYYDQCVEKQVQRIFDDLELNIVFGTDEHYQCDKCLKHK